MGEFPAPKNHPFANGYFHVELSFNVLDARHGIKKSAIFLEGRDPDPPSFLDIEIPFDWEGDDGLEPSLDGSYEYYVDPSSNRRGDLSKAFIPLPGFSKYSSQYHPQDDHSGIINVISSHWKSTLWLLIFSAFLIGPAFILKVVPNEDLQDAPAFQFYKKYAFLAFFFQFCLIFYLILWRLVNHLIDIAYEVTHEHHFDASKRRHNSAMKQKKNNFQYSVIFSILKPQTFEIIMMSKNAIFFFIFIASISIVFKVCYSIYSSSQYWANSFAALMINRTLNEALMVITIVTIQRIIFSKIVSDFYLTVYSERLMDHCFAIQAIRRLLTHVKGANEQGHFCHKNCHAVIPKPRKIGSKNKSLALLSSYYKNKKKKIDEAQDESIEPIISSYSQFRQLLLNSAQFEGIIDSKEAAKRTARHIYEHFYLPPKDKFLSNKPLKHKRKHTPSHLEHTYSKLLYLPMDAEINRGHFSNIFNPEDEEKLFTILELSESSAISPLEFKIALIKLFLEKEALSKNLLDHGGAVEKLDHLCSFVVFAITLILTPLIIGLPVKELFATLGGLCSLSFVFGQSSAVLFNSIIFIFITHPFDVGDRILVFSDTYFVHEIGIYYTVLQTIDSLLVYVPNYLLIEQHIVNIKRSKNMAEWIDIVVDYNTSTAKMALLASRVRSIIENENKYFELDLTQQGSGNSLSSLIKCVEMVNCRSFRLGIILHHKFNFQDGFKRVYRHFKFLKAIHEALKELSIVYYPNLLRLRCDPNILVK